MTQRRGAAEIPPFLAVDLAAKLGGALGSAVVGGAAASVQSAPVAVAVVAEAPVACVATMLGPNSGSGSSVEAISVAQPPASPALSVDTKSAPDAQALAAQLLAADRRLFDMARTAFAAGDWSAALGAIVEHAGKFPRSQFASARERRWIVSLVRAGRTTEARARLDGLRKRAPKSATVAELERLLPAGP